MTSAAAADQPMRAPFRAIDLIRKKRDGGELSPAEVKFMVEGYTRETIADYQMSAFLMAVLLRGMTGAELAALTEAMLHSGEVLDLSAIPGRKVDKHSTGGVGDKTSLVLAPLVAAAGVKVPMISGRGLGHTGGTLDKLEAIPGFNVNLSLADFRRVLSQIGCCMIGQTAEIAPADKKIYALRDVTGTVESPNLICASIMSKKLAEGVDGLVLDVKTGCGAFMKREEDSIHLANLMVETGRRMGKKMVALITDMDQPLGNMIGNALEVVECVEIMRGAGPADLRDVTMELAAWMFVIAERVPSLEEGRKLAEETIASGRALERFRDMVRAHGGDARVADDFSILPQATHQATIAAQDSGAVQAIQCEQVGIAGVVLGGGRERKEDSIDHAVGIVLHKKVGDTVRAGEALCTVHYNDAAKFAAARAILEASYTIGEARLKARPLIRKIIQ